MYRLFVAIDLPSDIKKQLGRICFGLPGAKWVESEQLHLTVRFIGEVDGLIFENVAYALSTVRCEPFEIKITGMGFFPPRKVPNTLWAGIEKNDNLKQLHDKVESALVRAGLDHEKRKFAPHITLARLKDTPVEKVAAFLAGYGPMSLETFQVEEFCLYSSFLSSNGAIHQKEAEFPLKPKGADEE